MTRSANLVERIDCRGDLFVRRSFAVIGFDFQPANAPVRVEHENARPGHAVDFLSGVFGIAQTVSIDDHAARGRANRRRVVYPRSVDFLPNYSGRGRLCIMGDPPKLLDRVREQLRWRRWKHCTSNWSSHELCTMKICRLDLAGCGCRMRSA